MIFQKKISQLNKNVFKKEKEKEKKKKKEKMKKKVLL